jgi:hypothetical protein
MPLEKIISDRFSRLHQTLMTERGRQFSEHLRQIKNEAVSRGNAAGGAHFSAAKKAHEQELGTRASLAWQSLHRAHQTSGSPLSDDLIESLKAELHQSINALSTELNESLQVYVARLPNFAKPGGYNLDAMRRHWISKTDLEIEIYGDSLMNKKGSHEGGAAQYYFFGAVGAVQTGANAQASIIQNLDGSDKNALLEAIRLARDAIQAASDFDSRKQEELLQVAGDCTKELSSDNPNSTRLLTMLSVLASSIQTVASAQPAYQALKTALLPLGITLP